MFVFDILYNKQSLHLFFPGFKTQESIKETLGFVASDYTEELARAHPTVRFLADSCASPIIQVYPDIPRCPWAKLSAYVDTSVYGVWMFSTNMSGSYCKF